MISLITITLTSLSIFIGFYVFYFLICLIYIKRSNKYIPDKCLGLNDTDLPTVSLIIPVYNEIKVIPKKFENLKNLLYPIKKLEIIFVDGGSTDGSANQIESLSKQTDLSIILIRQGSRKGFNNAVIEGFYKTTGEIIFIPGAETEYDPKALILCVKHFLDPNVGVVTGRQIIKNVHDNFTTKLESSYRSLYNFLREAESNLDSPFLLQGEISSARRNIVQRLVENPEFLQKGNIDSCFTFQARMDKLKTIYEPQAVYYDLSPSSFRDSWKQQMRRASTLIQNMLIFKKMILNKNFGLFGLFIMPSNFLMLIILPFIFLFIVLGILTLVFLYPSNYIFFSLIITGLILITISKSIQAFIKAQLVLIMANIKLIIGVETQKFERLESTRM